MKFEINGNDVEIIEINEYDPSLIVDGTARVGCIHYINNTIYLMENLTREVKKRTLLHELTHAFLNCNGMLNFDNFSQEQMCEFIAYHGENIVNICNKYFEEKSEG